MIIDAMTILVDGAWIPLRDVRTEDVSSPPFFFEKTVSGIDSHGNLVKIDASRISACHDGYRDWTQGEKGKG